MSKKQDVDGDPYGYAEADRLFNSLKPILKMLQGLPLQTLLSEFGAAERRLKAVALQAEARYFACLRSLPANVKIDHGEHPAKFIAAQLAYPELRKLYVQRRVTARLHEFFELLIRGAQAR